MDIDIKLQMLGSMFEADNIDITDLRYEHLSFAFVINDEIEVKGNYFPHDNFVIKDYCVGNRAMGMGRKGLMILKNVFNKHKIKLYVDDVTNNGFAFWIKMYGEKLIDKILHVNVEKIDENNDSVAKMLELYFKNEKCMNHSKWYRLMLEGYF